MLDAKAKRIESGKSAVKMRGSIIALLVACIVQAAQGKPAAGKVIKEDLAHISCEVCERVVDEIFLAINLAKATTPRGVLDELNIVEIIESISNPTKESGEWIKKLDIIEATVKDKNYLSIIEPGGSAKCLNECSTISQSSQNLLQDEIDADELSALLWKNKETPTTLKEKVCKKWTSRCRPRRKALPASYKRTDEEFVAQSEKDIEMERMMASMAAMGMGGSLYNRDDLGEMMGGLDDYDQEEAGMGMDPVDGDAPGQFNTAGGGYEL